MGFPLILKLCFWAIMNQQKIILFVVFLLSDVPASAMYFASYEVIMRMLVSEGSSRSELSIGSTIFAGKICPKKIVLVRTVIFNFTKKNIIIFSVK